MDRIASTELFASLLLAYSNFNSPLHYVPLPWPMGCGTLWEIGPPRYLRACANHQTKPLRRYPKRRTLRGPHFPYPDAHFVFDRLAPGSASSADVSMPHRDPARWWG